MSADSIFKIKIRTINQQFENTYFGKPKGRAKAKIEKLFPLTKYIKLTSQYQFTAQWANLGAAEVDKEKN